MQSYAQLCEKIANDINAHWEKCNFPARVDADHIHVNVESSTDTAYETFIKNLLAQHGAQAGDMDAVFAAYRAELEEKLRGPIE